MITLALAAMAFAKPSCCQIMASFADDPNFVALHEAPLQTDFTPQYGHMGTVAGASAFIVPANSDSNVGVLLIHEWWGLNNQIKSTAEKLHSETGYGVVAVDLYGGKVATTPADAAQAMKSVDQAKATAQLHDTVLAMRNTDLLGHSISKLGTLGYCFGGGWSLRTAIDNGKDVDACVMYYGYPETDPARLANLSAPLLGIFANRDPNITPSVVDRFKDALQTANKSFDIQRYDAVHGFANPSNPHYDADSTSNAWMKTIAFYKKHLG